MSRRYRRSPFGRFLFILLLAAIVAVRWYQSKQRPAPPEVLDEGIDYRVERVVDGDTLLLTNNARVRLLGIDTPETKKKDHPIEPWGPEATDYTKRFVSAAGDRVQLEFDKERVDRYGRALAYVFSNGRFLNEELVRAGLARVRHDPFSSSVRRKLRKAEDEAKTARRGIWSGTRPDSRK